MLRQRAVRGRRRVGGAACRSSRAPRCALQFMRWDEHGWDNYGPPQLHGLRAASTRSGNLVATETTIFGVPCYTTKPAEALVGLPSRQFATIGADRTRPTRHAVQPAEPPRDRRSRCRCRTSYLKTIWLRAPARPADDLRLRADDRRARVRGEDGSVPVPAPEHRHAGVGQANGLTALTWDRWKNVLTKAAPARELAAEGRSVDLEQSGQRRARAAASRSAASPARRWRTSPRSR